MAKSTGNYYSPITGSWQRSGKVPTAAMFDAVHSIFNKKPGVEALYLAMCLRPDGCSVATFQAAGTALKLAYGDNRPCGPANNTRKALQLAGIITVDRVPGSNPQALVIKVTPKGEAVHKARQGVAAAMGAVKAKPATTPPAKVAKPASKPRKPVAAKVTVDPPLPTPAVDATTTTTPQA